MNKTELLKKLLPGLLPLFIFIAADEIWGTEIGIYVALTFGLGELIFIYIKEKRIDRFVIIDTILLVVLGLISILLENDIFFKLKPALIEAILCTVLGISAFSKKNIMLLMTQRYMKGVNFTKAQEKQMLRSIKIMFWIFTIHTLLIIYSAYFMSKEMWVFISGGLFYILFAVFFLYEFLRSKLKMNKFKKEEWLPLVDNEGKIVGKAQRSECHSNKELLHPVVHVHIFNNKGELYLQKRPETKDTQPGKWDTSVGGHISFGESLEQALKKEIREETGLENLDCKFFKKHIWVSDIETELVYIFVANYNQLINHINDEIADGRFWKISEIEENLGKQIFTPNFEFEFVTFIKSLFKKIVSI